MSYALMSNNSRDLWSEVRKSKGRNSKYLYNSVQYNVDDMHAIEN